MYPSARPLCPGRDATQAEMENKHNLELVPRVQKYKFEE